jgi:hypothetical protein
MNTPVAELDWIPIKDLPQQYGVSKTAFYNRLTALGVEPMKRGTKSYISSHQLDLLNELHQYMHSGGTMTDFMELHGLANTPTNGHQHQTKYSSEPQPSESQRLPHTEFYNQTSLALGNGNTTQTTPVVLVTIDALKGMMYQPASSEPLDYLEKLEKCCEHGWILSTSEVSQLLGLSAKTIARYGKSFDDSGFVFNRAGKKRAQIAWQVKKGNS